MRVQMLVTISGGRADGRDWPPAGAELDLSDGEGMDLCAARLARPVAVAAPVETAVPEPAAVETRAEPDPEPDPEPAPVPVVERPAVNAPKDAWVAHAVSQGHDPAAAAAATKTDLLAAAYGPAGRNVAAAGACRPWLR